MTETTEIDDTQRPPENETDEIQVVTPVVVEMGELSRKKLKAFKKGEGPLMDDVLEVLEDVAAELGEEASDKTFVPIVMLHEKKPKKKKRTIVLPF